MNRKILTIGFYLCIAFIVIFPFLTRYLFVPSDGLTLEEIDPTISWHYINKEFITPSDAPTRYQTSQPVTIPHRLDDSNDTVFTYGTYIAKLNIPEEMIHQEWAFYIPFEYGSYELFVDENLIAKNGVNGKTKETQIIKMSPTVGVQCLEKEEIYLVMHLSNFYSTRGGFAQPIKMGEPTAINKENNSNLAFLFFMNGIIFSIGLFMFLIGALNWKNQSLILFSILWLIISIRSLFARPFVYSITIFDIPWLWAVKIEAICTLVAIGIMIRIIYCLHLNRASNVILIVNAVVVFTQLLITIATEPQIFQQTLGNLFIISILSSFYIFYILFKRLKNFTKEQMIFIISIILVIFGAFHDFIVVYLVINTSLISMHTVVISVLLQVFLLSWQFSQKLHETARLNKDIMALNLTLDQKIMERTKELEVAKNELQILAFTDGLTGIANRYIFNIKIKEYFYEAVNKKRNLSLLMMDLDYFKKYNDFYGHIVGDQLLKNMVSVIKAQLPNDTLFTRYGGEEFAILALDYTNKELEFLSNTILESVRKQKFPHEAAPNKIVTISIGGYTMTSTHTLNHYIELVAKADEQLYIAKDKGRNIAVIK